jgi:lysine-N-methylase
MAVMKTLVQIPEYLLKFQCQESACENNCCHGWTIHIDKQTFKFYQKCRDKSLARDLSTHFKRNKDSASNQDYATLILTADHTCPFLTENRLCRLQLAFGLEGLSQTCAIYPRSLNHIEGHFSQSLTLSCSPAARMILLNPEPMKFIQKELPIPVGTPLAKIVRPGRLPVSAWAIHRFIIRILQARRYSVHERMLLLGIFCDNLQDTIQKESGVYADSLIARFQDILNAPEKTEIHVKTLDGDPRALQLQVLSAIIGGRLNQGIPFKPFLDFYGLFVKGLEYTPGMLMEDLVSRYLAASQHWYAPFMDKHPYILENYLVNYCFRNAFPYETGQASFGDFVKLSIHYGLIQMHLTGIAGFYRETFSQEHVVEFISAHARVIEHHVGYTQWIYDWFARNKVDDLPSMAVLLQS